MSGATPNYDVVVIGGGPGGCSAAIALAQRGYRVTVCEAKSYPHDKVCGEFLSPECASLLDQLEAGTAVRALGPAIITRVRLTAESAAWESHLPGPAWGLSRRALDATLARHAERHGVALRTATTVSAISGNLADGFSVAARQAHQREEVLRARLVIGAYGKRSSLDHALQRRFIRQPQPYLAFKAHFHGPRLPGQIHLHAFTGGYVGISEIETGEADVCLLVHEAAFHRLAAESPLAGQADLRAAFFDTLRRHSPPFADWLGQARRVQPRWLAISQVPFTPKASLEGDVLMVGDAAGLIAPLAGNGMAMALRGGLLAARFAAAYLAGRLTAAQVRRHYPVQWRREFALRLRLGRALQALMLRPRWFAAGLKLATAFPELGEYFLTRTRHVRPAAGWRTLGADG